MREMMEAKLMALKKLKSKMKDMMRMEKSEPHHEEEMVSHTPKEFSYEIETGDEDMHNIRDGVKGDEEMIPRRRGRTKNIMMSMSMMPRKFGKK